MPSARKNINYGNVTFFVCYYSIQPQWIKSSPPLLYFSDYYFPMQLCCPYRGNVHKTLILTWASSSCTPSPL